MMSSATTSASKKIIETIRRGSSFIFGTDHPDLPLIKTNPEYDDNPAILPFRLGFLTPEMQEEAMNELNETDDTRQNCLNTLRQLIKDEKNLVSRIDDNFLLQFLRARKFDTGKAFKLLQNYFQFRKEYSHIYNSIDVKIVKQVILNNYLGYLTMRDREQCIVLIIKFGMWNPNVDSFEEFMKAMTGILVHAAEDPATQVTGFRIIIDCRGLSWKQMKYCTPKNIYMMVRSTQFCFPARYKAIHMFSENRLFSIAWSIIHPILTSKLKKRIMHHGTDVKVLQQYIHPSILPEEYGGSQGPFDNASWAKIIDGEETFMMDMLRYGYK